MGLIQNPKYDPSKPASNTNQAYVFENPNEVINPTTGQTAISAASLQPAAAIQLPKQPNLEVPSVTTGQAEINALAQMNQPTETIPTPTTPVPVSQPTTNTLTDIFNKYFKTSSENAPISQETAYNEALGASGVDTLGQEVIAKNTAVKQAQNEFNLINAQLKAITDEATAIPIQAQQEAAGRGITAAGLAPITTAKLRENALKALPLQAQALAAQAKVTMAQGDVQTAQQTLQLAQNKLDTLFNLKVKDAENQYNYRKDLIDKVYEFATTEQKRQLEEKKTADDRAYTEQKENINLANNLAVKAMQNGYGDAMSTLASLDTKDPEYLQKVFKLLGPYQVNPDEAAKAFADLEYTRSQTAKNISEAKFAEQKSKAEISKIYSDIAKTQKETSLLGIQTTGQVVGGVTGNADADAFITGIRNGTYKPSDVPKNLQGLVAQGLAQITPEMKNADLEKANKLKESISQLKNNSALSRVVGPISSKLPTVTGSGADFIAYFNNIKSLLTLENLGLMKGVLSDTDIKILQQAATPLTLEMSEKSFKNELTNLENTIDKAIKRASNVKIDTGTTVMVGPDGISYSVPNDQVDSFIKAGGKRK